MKLGGHSGQATKGNLTLSSSGMRFEGGDRKVEVKQEDVEGMAWGRIGKSFQLRVSQSDGSVVRSLPHPPHGSRISIPHVLILECTHARDSTFCVSGACEGRMTRALIASPLGGCLCSVLSVSRTHGVRKPGPSPPHGSRLVGFVCAVATWPPCTHPNGE